MLLKQVNRTARIAWAPSSEFGSLLASGTIGGTIDGDSFETKSQLEVYDIHLSSDSPKMKKLGAITTDDSFQSIAWGTKGLEDGSFKHGLIAGGMSNGQVRLWDASAVMGSHEKSHVSVCVHKGPVDGLDFHPKQANLLAGGASDGEVLIWDLVDPYKPTSTKQNRGARSSATAITALAWNQKVQHILASASEAGEILIWDVRNEKVVMSLKNAFRTAVKPLSLSWNPESSTQLGVCYEKQNVVELWDLRNAMAPKLKLGGTVGHAPDSGIMDLAWCPYDQNVILTTGQDQRHIAWEANTGAPLQQYASPGPVHNLRWCPSIPSILASCSQDSKVSIESFNSFGKHVPKWLERPTGCSFGFGGGLVSFGLELEVISGGEKKGTQTKTKPDSKLTVSSMVTEPQLVELAESLQAMIKEGSQKRVCDEKVQHSNDEHERSEWRFIQIFYEDKPHQKKLLMKELGFEAPLTGGESETTPKEKRAEEPVKPKAPEQEDDESFWEKNSFGEEKVEGTDDLGDVPPPARRSESQEPVSTGGLEEGEEETADEKAIREALIVADFKTAVNKCFQTKRYADAIFLATMASRELWESTRAEYLRIHKNPFIKNVMRAVCSQDFRGLADNSDIRDWKQTLSVLMTYTKDDEYRTLVDRLAERLQRSEIGELARCAIFCYICSANIDKAVEIWEQENSAPTSEDDQPVYGLHRTMEKIAVFARAIPGCERSRCLALKYSEYAGVLASQGNLAAAHSFLQLASKEGKSEENAELIHRIEAALHHEKMEERAAQSGAHHAPAPVVAPPATHTPARALSGATPTQAPTLGHPSAPARSAVPRQDPRLTQDPRLMQQDPRLMQQDPRLMQQDPRLMDPRLVQQDPRMQEELLRKAEYDREMKARLEAEQRARLEAEARARLEAEARAKQEAEARQRQEQERARLEHEQRQREAAERQRQAELARAPPPYYTSASPHPSAAPTFQSMSSAPTLPSSAAPLPPYSATPASPSPSPPTYVSPPGRIHSPTPASPALASLPTGSGTSSAPPSPSPAKPPATLTPEQNEVVNVFEGTINLMLATKPKPTEKKKILEFQKRIAKLYHQFDKLSATANATVIELATAVKNRDYKTAEDKHLWLVTNEWQGNHNWLPGVKTLIGTARKLLK